MIYETKNKEYCLIDKINSTVFLKKICASCREKCTEKSLL